MSDEELTELEDVASPGAGACGGQFTANTMATAFEMLGISAMGTSMVPAEDGKKGQAAEDCGRLVMKLLERRPPRRAQIITKESLENAIAGAARPAAPRTPCSTCSRSPARPASRSTIDDFDQISWRPRRCSPT